MTVTDYRGEYLSVLKLEARYDLLQIVPDL